MIPEETLASDFFVAGGTLRAGAQSYVTRPADKEFLAATMAGEFCYVLTPRQMGKSSLMVRTARALQAAGARTVILDLTSIGTDVTVEQWYLGLISRINSRLNRSFDLAAWWGERAQLSVVQRFTEYLREVMLQTDERVVIFIDEIDTTLSLDFRDDFFAAIRYFYNMRSDESGLEKLSIALLGVATPADLIRDRTRTPFNIGRRIELNEFSRSDARLLEQGLEEIYPGKGMAVFDRIYYWTNGHPYLTQKLCLVAGEDATCAESPDQVDAVVHQLFLSEAARRETNLQFIRDNIVSQPPEEMRRLLMIYRDVLRNKRVIEDERSAAQNRLKLIGLVKGNDRVLTVRNNVYRTVFNEQWIKETAPADWNRRIAVGALVLVLLMTIGVGYFIWNSRQQTTERLIEEQETLFQSGNPSVQLTSLAALYNGAEAATVEKADALYGSLSQADRLSMFDPDVTAGLDSPLAAVALALIARQENTPESDELLARLAGALDASSDGGNVLLGNGIEQWLAGRGRDQEGDFAAAVGEYRDAESLLDRNPSPALYYDLGVAYSQTDEADNALAYLERAVSEVGFQSMVTLATLPIWRARVAEFIPDRPELLGRWSAGRDSFPALAAILPTPTLMPTATQTPEPTLTLAVSLTPSRTPEPTATAAPTETVTGTATATPEGPPTLVVQRNANLRAGPGLDYGLIVAVPRDTELEIIGRTLTGDWYNILYLGRPGWISSGFVLVDRGDERIEVVATVPPRPTATRTPTAQPAPTTPATLPPSGGGGGGSSGSPPTAPPPTEPPATEQPATEPPATEPPRFTPTP